METKTETKMEPNEYMTQQDVDELYVYALRLIEKMRKYRDD